DPNFAVFATASSNLAVTFTATGNCTVTSAGMVHLTAPGSCSVTASRAGNATYNPAPPVTQSFTIGGNTAAIISSILPTCITAGGAGLTLTVNGSGFMSGSVVSFNSSARTTTFISSTQLSAAIPASDLLAGGGFAVTVFNP